MVFSGSMEFEKRVNPEVQERPSDNVELPKVTTIYFLWKNKTAKLNCTFF